MKKILILVSIVSLWILVTACGKNVAVETCPLTWNVACWTTSWTVDHSNLSGAIDAVLLAIKNNDLLTLSTFVGSQWLRFSPYEYVNTGSDIVLSTEEVYNGLSISRSYTWGTADGSGMPLDLWIGQYFEKFVNDADYANAPEILYNQSVQRGNMINNIAQVYSGKQWVEFYFSGFDAQYDGMDRKSLTLVFDHVAGQRYLIGIVHGARTI